MCVSDGYGDATFFRCGRSRGKEREQLHGQDNGE